jgi:hypothetical protein
MMMIISRNALPVYLKMLSIRQNTLLMFRADSRAYGLGIARTPKCPGQQRKNLLLSDLIWYAEDLL